MQKDDFLDKDSFYSETGFQVTNRAKSFLATAASWSKFLAIMGFIGTAIMILGSIAIMLVGSSFGGMMDQNPVFGAVGGLGIGFMYLVLALIYLFPSIFLLKFSSKTKESIRNSDSLSLEDGFKNLKYLEALV